MLKKFLPASKQLIISFNALHYVANKRNTRNCLVLHCSTSVQAIKIDLLYAGMHYCFVNTKVELNESYEKYAFEINFYNLLGDWIDRSFFLEHIAIRRMVYDHGSNEALQNFLFGSNKYKNALKDVCISLQF